MNIKHRNILNNLICVRISSYYQDICNKNKRNSEVMWDHLNELRGRKTCNNKLPILIYRY